MPHGKVIAISNQKGGVTFPQSEAPHPFLDSANTAIFIMLPH